MYNLDQFYPSVSKFLLNKYSELNPAVVYPYPFWSNDPNNCIFDSTVEIPRVVFLIYDQEPIFDSVPFLDHFGKLFQEWNSTVILITTQQWGVNLQNYCNTYNWHTVYYFHHALASLDWYRGYYKNPLLDLKQIDRHFYSLNRLFDDPHRSHRKWLVKDFSDRGYLEQSYFSFPNKDSITGRSYHECTGNNIDLPLTLDHHENGSHELELEYANRSFVNVVTETVFDLHENYITEKSFKPIVSKMPFVILGPPRTIQTLRKYGFVTFSAWWDESYDRIQDNRQRYQKVLEVLEDIGNMSLKEIETCRQTQKNVLEHNHRHFYSNNFKNKVLNELFSCIDTVIKSL